MIEHFHVIVPVEIDGAWLDHAPSQHLDLALCCLAEEYGGTIEKRLCAALALDSAEHRDHSILLPPLTACKPLQLEAGLRWRQLDFCFGYTVGHGLAFYGEGASQACWSPGQELGVREPTRR